ncbi:putative glycoside hydrolase [Desulfosarcina sp.]|uniref:putative glycoside hydrolase n=1 Tax=Desulfosarcina sp. TaxID=2027861 RepID=UPI00356B5704
MAFVLVATAFNRSATAGTNEDCYNALYIPPHKITKRTFDEIVHYAALTPVNAVVLHVKSPRGKLLWPSENAMAIQLGVEANHSGLEKHVARLKRDNIRTIAKLDVFADHQLAAIMPELSVMDSTSGTPWTDANDLHWANPSDSRVWEYNIALSKELAAMGFDEIQFDYVRFPSDGDLSIISYPNTLPGFSKSDCIASFLAKAHDELNPLGVSVSADVFGLTAWKTDDFGVGQVLEKMAPHLDIICPMFYPSHFPRGFLGKQSPGEFPEMIMESSMRSMMNRTDKPIRPWIQGFWYSPQQIAAQIDGIENASASSWSIWSPTGRYRLSYEAMAARFGVSLSRPTFYPSVADLASEKDRSTRGISAIVNFTSFKMGYSILSLETSEKGKRSRYSSPDAILATLEEGIMDRILTKRAIRFNRDAEPYTKRRFLSELLCNDLGKDARRMRPGPIHIDWAQDCTFSATGIPPARLDKYAQAERWPDEKKLAGMSSSEPINIASISESIFGVSFDPVIHPAASLFSPVMRND